MIFFNAPVGLRSSNGDLKIKLIILGIVFDCLNWKMTRPIKGSASNNSFTRLLLACANRGQQCSYMGKLGPGKLYFVFLLICILITECKKLIFGRAVPITSSVLGICRVSQYSVMLELGQITSPSKFIFSKQKIEQNSRIVGKNIFCVAII